MRSIGLIGKSGSGKTSVARLLNLYSGFEVVSTGTICRQIATLLFGNEDKATTQRLDDALTAIDPSIFLKAALRTVPHDRLICLDALRFKSDITIAQQRGLVTVRIEAAEDIRNARLAARRQIYDAAVDRMHRSETELDDSPVDFTLTNNTNSAGLENSVRELCKLFQ